jgi:hypothetical protein
MQRNAEQAQQQQQQCAAAADLPGDLLLVY